MNDIRKKCLYCNNLIVEIKNMKKFYYCKIIESKHTKNGLKNIKPYDDYCWQFEEKK